MSTLLLKEHSEFKPCPQCGLSNNPKLEIDDYDTCLTCRVCKYFTGYQYLDDSIVMWNTTGLNMR